MFQLHTQKQTSWEHGTQEIMLPYVWIVKGSKIENQRGVISISYKD